jgi:hypothetical protein
MNANCRNLIFLQWLIFLSLNWFFLHKAYPWRRPRGSNFFFSVTLSPLCFAVHARSGSYPATVQVYGWPDWSFTFSWQSFNKVPLLDQLTPPFVDTLCKWNAQILEVDTLARSRPDLSVAVYKLGFEEHQQCTLNLSWSKKNLVSCTFPLIVLS